MSTLCLFSLKSGDWSRTRKDKGTAWFSLVVVWTYFSSLTLLVGLLGMGIWPVITLVSRPQTLFQNRWMKGAHFHSENSLHMQMLVVVECSVVTTTELSPPPRWLATTEPTLPSRCFAVSSAVFLGAVSWKLPLTLAVSFDPCVNVNARQDNQPWHPLFLLWTSSSVRSVGSDTVLLSPSRLLSHSQTTGLPGHSTKWDCYDGLT